MIKGIIEAALTIEPMSDEEEIKRRYDICKSCPRFSGFENKKKGDNDKCLECGCYMEIKTGLKYNRNPKKGFRIEVTHCPLGKWGDLAVANSYRERDGLEPIT
jgi:hypothetical protein